MEEKVHLFWILPLYSKNTSLSGSEFQYKCFKYKL